MNSSVDVLNNGVDFSGRLRFEQMISVPPVGKGRSPVVRFEAGNIESQVWETSEVLSAGPVDEDESDRECMRLLSPPTKSCIH
jgi:hypothetical protein